jgi:Fe(3+) dicitrate transport protein
MPRFSAALPVLFRICLAVACVLPSALAAPADGPADEFAGRVLDSSGAAIAGARVTLRLRSSGAERVTHSDALGVFVFAQPPRGHYDLQVAARGFAAVEQGMEFRGGRQHAEISLAPAALVQEMHVTATRIVGTPEEMERLPGSYGVLNAGHFTESRIFTTDEALRKIPGLLARGEEGFGLRPNIGVRGLNPTRSTQILLLEDGLPLAFAPYGDNASYYHPPIDRFDGVEVVKGGGQIVYGPRTVGAVVNYLTPAPPEKWGGALTLTGGNRNYLNGHVRFGGTWRGTGILVDLLRKQGQGARENTRHGLDDFNVKTLSTLSARQTLSARFNVYDEDSQVTYSGLRQSEFAADPRANPFSNDHFDGRRYGASLRHSWAPRENLLLSTSGYGTVFSRDWWRQSSNSNQRPNDAADPACASMANLHTTCGNEGRLRDYSTFGVESKVRASFAAHGLRHAADLGVRWHFEDQQRRQRNGATPTARTGVLVEDNQRAARAFSIFAQDSVLMGGWRFTPGVRLEKIHYERTNRLGAGGAGVSGKEDLLIAVPGFGLSYGRSEKIGFFAGFHRGFAPPRVEDVISNSTGASINLDPELSWNFEAGLRLRPTGALRAEAAFFRMDFENQIVPASVAGGLGATLTNAGQTLHQGLELSGQYDWRNALGSPHGFYLRGAYTFLPVARFAGARFSSVPGFSAVSVSGNRLPYAPENLLTASAGFLHRRGMNAQVEVVYTGRQFGDDLNTVAGSADGQRGAIPGNALWNVTVNYPLEEVRATFYLTVKNVFNRTVVVDRARGLLPGIPRLVQAGIHWNF